MSPAGIDNTVFLCFCVRLSEKQQMASLLGKRGIGSGGVIGCVFFVGKATDSVQITIRWTETGVRLV
ncbi:MAG TPA: hypothetical protein DEF45_18150 [Rhodopirellula sp.]|nr:hypothetical protein [Rhodopirellula sp.]